MANTLDVPASQESLLGGLMHETHIKVGDTEPLRATLRDGTGTAVDLTGATVLFRAVDASTRVVVVSAAAAVEVASLGQVRYDWATADVATARFLDVEFRATLASGKIRTFPGEGSHRVVVGRLLP